MAVVGGGGGESINYKVDITTRRLFSYLQGSSLYDEKRYHYLLLNE